MSLPAEWLDPSSADPARDTERGAAPDPEERAERAARADAAVIAARAARASLAASAAGASGAVLDPVLEPTLEPELEPTLAPQAAIDPAVGDAEEPYGRLTLTGGIVGRMILAFVTGCLVITLVPILFGWRPYVVKSGSMEPRIGVGDVILASPDHNPKSLLGHVTVFDDPGAPGTVKSHRIIRINPDGTLTSKGDANPTADPQPVSVAHVHGIGRLLVRWAGLPMIWLRTGQYLFLGLFILVLGSAAWAVARDSEEDDYDEDDDATNSADSADLDGDGERATARTPADAAGGPTSTRAQRRQAAVLERRARRRRTIAVRTLASAAGISLLVVPSASAAFSATTRTTGSSWTVPTYSYPTTVKSFATPYLYWQLGDTGTSAADASGNGRTGTYAGTYTQGVTGGTPHTSPNTAVTATTSTACINTTSTTAITGPTVFTEIIWFKTAAGYAGGGKLIGFETPRTGVGVAGSGGNYDRHVYMDGAGKIWFGVYNGGNDTISSPASYNDGNWHMAAATISSSGMALYVDGVLRGTNSNTVAEASTGWWRVGCGNLSGWGSDWTGANNPGTNSAVTVNAPFLGSLDEATIYSGTALTAANISLLYWTR